MFAFSTENWRRPPDEVRYLMHFNEGILTRHRDDLNEKGVRIRFSGRRDWRVPVGSSGTWTSPALSPPPTGD